MTSNRKPHLSRNGNTAKCGRCGATSRFVYGFTLPDGGLFGFWKWWRRFKQTHAHPENRA